MYEIPHRLQCIWKLYKTYLYDCSFLLAVTQDVVDSISSNLDDVGNKIIDTMEGTVEALQSAEMTGNNKNIFR